MRKLLSSAKGSSASDWLKDVAALLSIGAFVWVAGTWAAIAQSLLIG